MATKIFVMTHKKFDPPTDPVYIPVHVGRALHEDLGYVGDNTGDNISDKNPLYSELTGLYWCANNISDVDYMGLCHYRRFFLNEAGALLSEAECETILSEYDVIMPTSHEFDKPYYEVYRDSHNIYDLDVVGNIMKRLYPADYEVFEEIIHNAKVYNGNLFITSKELYKEYAKWLFSIFDEAEKEIDVSTYDEYHKRVYGFLSEQMLYVWVKSRGLSIKEMKMGITEEKAETVEVKKELRNRLMPGSDVAIHDAIEYFRAYMDKRPDILLAGSDLNGELRDSYRILHVLDRELAEEPDRCMLTYSSDLQELLVRYRKLEGILLHAVAGKATEEELAYFMNAKVSHACADMIINNQTALAAVKGPLLQIIFGK